MINKLTTPIQFTCVRFILKVLWTNRRNAELNKSTSLPKSRNFGHSDKTFPEPLDKKYELILLNLGEP